MELASGIKPHSKGFSSLKEQCTVKSSKIPLCASVQRADFSKRASTVNRYTFERCLSIHRFLDVVISLPCNGPGALRTTVQARCCGKQILKKGLGAVCNGHVAWAPRQGLDCDNKSIDLAR